MKNLSNVRLETEVAVGRSKLLVEKGRISTTALLVRLDATEEMIRKSRQALAVAVWVGVKPGRSAPPDTVR